MTDPSDPFGQRDRTFIRPNPGGRRRQETGTPPASPGPQEGGHPWSSPGTNRGPERDDPRQGIPDGPEQRGSPPPGGQGNPWRSAGPSNPDPAPAPALALAPVRPQAQLKGASSNPLMLAAWPLMLLLGQLRAGLLRPSVDQLAQHVAQAIAQFEADVQAAGTPSDIVTTAKYVLAATADDVVQNLPQTGNFNWARYNMLARFFGEASGGVRFFDELNRAKANAKANRNLLELMHACLALGFEGIHRRSQGGPTALQRARRDLYELLRRLGSKEIEDLSPHWQGQNIPTTHRRLRIPVLAVAAVAGALLLTAYFVLRQMLVVDAGAVATELRQAHAGTVQIFRTAFEPVAPEPPPPPVVNPVPDEPPIVGPQLVDRVNGRLTNIPSCAGVVAEESRGGVLFRLANSVLSFASGSPRLGAGADTLIACVARAVDVEPGRIMVLGYTDNVPMGTTGRFTDNFALSEARAEAVATILRQALSEPGRVSAQGEGDQSPIATNDTAAGRELNRRVEIRLVPS